jgi:ammonium transporter, Amt family
MTKVINNKFMATVAFTILLVVCFTAGFINNPIPTDDKQVLNPGDVSWMIIASALVLLMTPGLAFFYGGMVTRKNLISTMLQSFICLAIMTVLWYVVGFSLAFGDDTGWGIVGNPMTHFMFKNVGMVANPKFGPKIPFVLFAAFQLKFAMITPALITGSFAERVKFWGYIVFVNLWSLIVYCPLAHMAWHPDGILAKWGVLDYAGGTVVHISAGIAAFIGALFLGRRRSHVEGESTVPVNIAYIILGTGLLWFGWFGFNAGSALEANMDAVKAFFNTNLASAVAAITWVMVDVMRGKKPSAVGTCIGAVVGLVAITPAAGHVDFGPALLIGFVGALVSNQAVEWVHKSSMDDTLDVFPCHGVGGMTGMLMTALFATADKGGLFTSHNSHLLTQHLKGMGLVVVFVSVGSFLLYKLTDLITPMRVDEEQEAIGLDISQHDETMALEVRF